MSGNPKAPSGKAFVEVDGKMREIDKIVNGRIYLASGQSQDSQFIGKAKQKEK